MPTKKQIAELAAAAAAKVEAEAVTVAADVKTEAVARWPVVKAFVVEHKKWFIGAAALILVWIIVAALVHKKPQPVALPPVVHITKTAPDVIVREPVRRKVVHHHVARKPVPAAKCQFLWTEVECP